MNTLYHAPGDGARGKVHIQGGGRNHLKRRSFLPPLECPFRVLTPPTSLALPPTKCASVIPSSQPRKWVESPREGRKLRRLRWCRPSLGENTYVKKTASTQKPSDTHAPEGFVVFYDYQKIPSPPMAAISPANTMETMDSSLIRMLTEGPAVSLKGSPTVSPTTAAL